MGSSITIRSYRDLEVWKTGIELTLACYAVTDGFPREERYGLTAQLRRAAVSVPSNIAEGHGRWHTRDYIRFLYIANGSLMELETELHIAQRLGLLNGDDARNLERDTQRLGRMWSKLIVRLKERHSRRP